MTTELDNSTVLAPVRKSVSVEVPPARAFEVFTAGFDTWWPRTHHIGSSEPFTGILEPRSGGRWYERGADGSETEWGEVLAYDPPTRLVVSWHLTGEYTYDPDPARASEIEVRFIPEGDNRTRVELEHRNFERRGAEDGGRVRSGVSEAGGWGSVLNGYAEAVKAG